MSIAVCLLAGVGFAALIAGRGEPSKATAGEASAEARPVGEGEVVPASTGAPPAPRRPVGPHPEADDARLLDPSRANARAPDRFEVHFRTTRGDFVVDVQRAWAPRGVDRLYNLVAMGFFRDIAFFRVVPGFVAQFGIHGRPDVARAWSAARLEDDPVVESNERGTVVFASAGPDSRTTQLFINFGDNRRLDGMGFAPLGRIVEGMGVVDAIHSGHGQKPDQGRIAAEGNAYLRADFAELDYILHAGFGPAPPAATGLRIEDLREGTGAAAARGDELSVAYVGTLKDSGAVFDQTAERGPFRFELGAGRVIRGWEEGLQGMKVGGKRRLTIPADMAYGARGMPPKIPPNATLVFEVELLAIAAGK